MEIHLYNIINHISANICFKRLTKAKDSHTVTALNVVKTSSLKKSVKFVPSEILFTAVTTRILFY